MKKIILIYILIFCASYVNGQSYGWIKGGGSTEGMNPAQSYRWEKITNICTDEHGNVYTTSVVGSSNIVADTFHLLAAHNTAYSQLHVLLSSYKCDGTMRWSKLLECSSDALVGRTNLGFMNYSMSYNNGSIYMAGEFDGYTKWIGHDTTFSNNVRSYTARFDTSGQFKWIRFIGPDSPATWLATGDAGVLAIDGQGYIHNFNAMKGDVHLIPLPFVTDTTSFWLTYDLKYDTSGNLVSANRVHLDSLWLMTKAVFDKNDNKIYAVLTPNQSYWFTYYSTWNTALAAFLPNGTQIWNDTTGTNGGVINMDYKGNNAIYICGQGQGAFSLGGMTVPPTSGSYIPIFKIDTNGHAIWNYCLMSSLSVDMSLDLTILPNQNVAVAGKIAGVSWHGTDTIRSTTGEMSNPALVIVDSSGHTVSLDQFHGPGNDETATCITSDAVGNVYVGGLMETTMSATGLSSYLSHGGNTDFFIVKYGYSCTCSVAPVAAFTRTGSPVASFTYTGTTTLLDSVVWHYGDGTHGTGLTSTHTYSTSGTFHPCATVYTQCGNSTYCDTITVSLPTTGVFTNTTLPITVYPNPATNELIIERADVGATFFISNMVGQIMYRGVVTTMKQAVNVQSLTPGAYIININDSNGYGYKATIIKQ